ncbi:MAG: S26 family signal peptidase [Oceanicaulis sp.]|uniref:S26 family signal peptidase n=1 Tax=Glycocaulis sp. TaxID=1969725 RepID=UPI0025C35862|nr:S26 family signal peptidase [Glycocaulis sp.]MCC5982655.1 S26 family signal peptidase [Oceanicaulis sp.]MCH8522369.1 S26 family signal peptidase [Glycocaulis sp.]
MNLSWAMIGRFGGIVAIGCVFVVMMNMQPRWYAGLNLSESLPHWAFIVDRGAVPGRGELAVFPAPETAAYDGLFVKRIVGVAGDLVEVEGQRVSVAGHWRGVALSESREGRGLEPIAAGVIPEGYVFAVTDAVDSYDSRYAEIGLIAVETIEGRAIPVL